MNARNLSRPTKRNEAECAVIDFCRVFPLAFAWGMGKSVSDEVRITDARPRTDSF